MPGLQLVIELDDKGAIQKVITLDGEFGKFTGGMGAKAAKAASAMQKISDSTRIIRDGFKGAAIAAAAFFGIDAAISVVRKGLVGLSKDLFNLVKQGAEINDIKETFEVVREKAGLLPGTLAEIGEATRRTVSDMDAMKISTRALADELDPGRIVEFWAKARQISEVSGAPITQVFEMLYLAVAKGQTRMLTGIGITLDAEEATAKYASTIGKTTAELSFQERQMGIYLALNEKYVRQFESLGEQGRDANEKFNQISTGVVNLKNKFLSMLADSPSVEKFLSMLIAKIGALSADMETWEPKIRAVVDVLGRLYEGVIQFASERAKPAIENIVAFKDVIVSLAAAIGTGMIASKIMGIAVALGWVTGPAALAVTAIAGALAGVTVGLVQSENQMQKTGVAFRGMHGGGMGAYEVFTNVRTVATGLNKDLTGLEGTLDSVIAKFTAPGLVGLKLPAWSPPAAATVAETDWDELSRQAQEEADFRMALSAGAREDAIANAEKTASASQAYYLDTIRANSTADEAWLNAKIGLAAIERDAVKGNAAEMAQARIDYDNKVKEAELAHNEAVWQDWLIKNQGMVAMMQGLEAGWDTMVETALDKEMTGKARREAMWESMKQSFLRSTSDMLKKELVLKVKNWVLAEAAHKPFTARERFDAAKVGAVKAYSAFAGIPIIGPVLGAIAAAAAFTFLMAFHKGGFIAGDERIIKVQTEEFVMQRSAVRNIGRENMEYMNATGRIPAGGTIATGRVVSGGGGQIGPFIFRISAGDKQAANDIAEFIDEKIVPMLETAIGRRKFSLEGEM